jgi:hypothetical protein
MEISLTDLGIGLVGFNKIRIVGELINEKTSISFHSNNYSFILRTTFEVNFK